MENFQTIVGTREAKEYLVRQILLQAQRDGISLSEIERKMLYFSENYWTLPDMATINQEFDRHYNQDEFEAKIGELVHHIKQELGNDLSRERQWDEAVRVLSQEDHYLLVLLNAKTAVDSSKTRPPGDFIKLILTALLIVTAMFAAMWLLRRQ
jgi:hypothetical protein